MLRSRRALTCSGSQLELEGVIGRLEAHVGSITSDIAHRGASCVGSQVWIGENGLLDEASGRVTGGLKTLGLRQASGHKLVRLEHCENEAFIIRQYCMCQVSSGLTIVNILVEVGLDFVGDFRSNLFRGKPHG